MKLVYDLATTCTSKRLINAINVFQKVTVFFGLFQCRHAAHTDSSCVLQFENETSRSGLLVFSLQNLMAGGQLWSRRESVTHIRRLLTHLAHLYSGK